MEKHDGGRWPIVSMDLGNKAVKDFTIQMKVEMTTPQEDTTLQALLEATQEGLQNDKARTQHPTIIPTALLHEHKRPQHYKLDVIRAIAWIYKKHTRATCRGHNIQRKEMPTTHRV
jgi:hypothetical protein